MPGTMPALGISLLKAGLARAGHDCDLLYGSTLLIEALAEGSSFDQALRDYQLVGTSGHLGDLLFAPAFWGKPDLIDAVRGRLQAAAFCLPAAERDPFLERLDPERQRMEQTLDRAFAARDWRQFRIVGFSSTFAQSLASLALARRIKLAAPDTMILFGGANVDGTMGAALLASFPFVDAVLQGECDHSLPRLVDAVLTGQPLAGTPGLVMRGMANSPSVPVTDLDGLAVPDFSDFFAQLPPGWRQDQFMLPFETSRGCWWGERSHCIFCGLNGDGMAYRAKSPERAIAEVDRLQSDWQVRRFWAVDNILPRPYFDTVLPALGQRDLELFYETKANLADGQVAALARAGVTRIQPGVESLSTRLLRIMKKGVSRTRNLQLLRSCQMHGVDPLWFYLYGFPGDTEEDYLDDAALMPLLVHLPPPRAINPVTVDRFSPLFRATGMTLHPQQEHRLAFAGLSDTAAADLCYHFDAQVGPADPDRYQPCLAAALAHWQARYRAGAQLEAHIGCTVTLLFDTRDADGVQLRMLSGLMHEVHRSVQDGASPALIAERCRGNAADPDPEDLPIVIAAASHGASFAPEVRTIDEALDWLEAAGLVARDGTVCQALALPRLSMLVALQLGLEAQTLEAMPVDP